MKFCSLLMGARALSQRWSDKRLAELPVLTKEKLHHYLAFECPIREIAAVSDRHCLATDSPRTCTQRYSAPLAQIYAAVCTVHSVSRTLPPSLSHSPVFYRTRREPPFYCTWSLSGFTRSFSFSLFLQFLTASVSFPSSGSFFRSLSLSRRRSFRSCPFIIF